MRGRADKQLGWQPVRRGKRAWTLEEVRVAKAAYEATQQEYRWGMPKKRWYTSGDVAQILGINWERLRYLLDTRQLSDCKRRGSKGERLWTEGEVERAVADSHGQLGNGTCVDSAETS